METLEWGPPALICYVKLTGRGNRDKAVKFQAVHLSSVCLLSTLIGPEASGFNPGLKPKLNFVPLGTQLQEVLDDEEKFQRLLESRGPDAQGILDYIQWLLADWKSDSTLWGFRKILIRADVACNNYPITKGRGADIYRGTLRGSVVAVKLFHDRNEDEHLSKRVVYEAILWNQLAHPNIIPFYGVCWFQNRLCVVSPWLEKRDIVRYLKDNPDAPRPPLALDVARGLGYLHDHDITHGNIESSNILIDDAGQALLAGFGYAAAFDAQEIVPISNAIRWQGPELFMMCDEPLKPTPKTDVYAWGCICYEIFTGQVPFADIQEDLDVIECVVFGLRPERPELSSPSWKDWALTEEIWLLMEHCWQKEPSKRPSASEIIRHLTARCTRKIRSGINVCLGHQMSDPFRTITYEALDLILCNVTNPKSDAARTARSVEPNVVSLIARLTFAFGDVRRYRQLSGDEVSDAQQVLDGFQSLLDTKLDLRFRNNLIVTMQRLSMKFGLYPACYNLTSVLKDGVSPEAVSGGFADIYTGRYRNQAVCLKMVRVYKNVDFKHFLDNILKEATLWAQLSHPNLLMFHGLVNLDNRLFMVAPWMMNRNISSYIKHNPGAPRLMLLNILVNGAGRALLADFGFSSISESDIVPWRSVPGGGRGTLMWRAPELIDMEEDEEGIFTGKRPFKNVRNEYVFMHRILSGMRPQRPEPLSLPWKEWGLTEGIWSLMEQCWNKDPSKRPFAADVVQFLAKQIIEDTVTQPTLLLTESYRWHRWPLDAHTLMALESVLPCDNRTPGDLKVFSLSTTNRESANSITDKHISGSVSSPYAHRHHTPHSLPLDEPNRGEVTDRKTNKLITDSRGSDHSSLEPRDNLRIFGDSQNARVDNMLNGSSSSSEMESRKRENDRRGADDENIREGGHAGPVLA
ncbi:hypothetical protein C0995_006365 [Termitomyces sp. Mi166|nr:hypothetical protein C0995_006365 [Termitomyces sp. Mi166\